MSDELRDRAFDHALSWYWSARPSRSLSDCAQLIAREHPHLMGCRQSYTLVFRAYLGKPRG